MQAGGFTSPGLSSWKPHELPSLKKLTELWEKTFRCRSGNEMQTTVIIDRSRARAREWQRMGK
jgi:hypothetical protein